MEPRTNNSFNIEVLQILKAYGQGFGRMELRVVSWDGAPPVLEKRQIIQGDDGAERGGRCKGFKKEDIEVLFEKWSEIKHLFYGK